MRALIDTNVVLDVLLNRKPFSETAAEVLKMVSYGEEEFISASSVTDIYYIAYRELRDKPLVKDLLRRLLQVIHIAAVSEREIHAALNADWTDFEDCVQNAVAEIHSFDAIVTRNPSDFAKSPLKIMSPAEFLEIISCKGHYE